MSVLRRKRIVLFILLGILVLASFCFFRRYQFTDNGAASIVKIIPSFLQPKALRQLSDLNTYPVIEDCRDRSALEYQMYTNSNDSLPQDLIDAILYESALYRQFTIREGYTLGRMRVVIVRLPLGSLCTSDYRLAIREDSTQEVLRAAGLLRALIVTQENLPLVGELIYGKANPEFYGSTAKTNHEKRNCLNPGKCTFLAPWPKDIVDGDITRDANGAFTLHRFSQEGIPSIDLVHHKIILNSDGSVSAQNTVLSTFYSGIMP